MNSNRPTDSPAGRSLDIEHAASRWLAQRDGDAWSDAHAGALDAWLQVDTAHRVAFLRLQAAWNESGRLQALGAGLRGDGPPPRGSWHTSPFNGRQAAPSAAAYKPANRMRIAGFAMVATCVLLAGLGWRAYQHVDVASYQTAMGEIRTQPLADGSRTTLASDSAVEIRLSHGERDVTLLRGEAIFAVAKDPGRPFVVSTNGHRVIAVGTRFSVRRDGEDLRVVVTEGTVRLESEPDDGSPGPSALLPAGSVALVRDGNVLVRSLPLADVERMLGWRDGLLAFRDTPLAEAASEFNRYNVRKLAMGDAEAGALRIGGSFRWDNEEGFVRLLEQGFPVRAEYAADQIVLHSR
ncbi:FecR domain-containing protein [Thermomonas sp.]|uniref:FecR family protein n=1 Tax=Thermomonas sp. TaxID=1971895 RepID=UPI002488B641|nr:FecR domain-containing protein [Thermomonas sp.]MDI1252435.1 FecR domain-containing protein [Thermomonas sp.]